MSRIINPFSKGRRAGLEGLDLLSQLEVRRKGSLSENERSSIDAIVGNLERGWTYSKGMEPRASLQGWSEVLMSTISDGTQVLNTVTETIMVPNFQLGANYLRPGSLLKWTVLFDLSTVITTPGTITFRLRHGINAAPASNTALATSGAFAPDPDAASANVTGMLEYWMVCRGNGAAASSYTMGRVQWNDYDDATVTSIIGNLNMEMIPVSAPAAVNIDTTVANFTQPSVTFSVATATTQLTSHIAMLESKI